MDVHAAVVSATQDVLSDAPQGYWAECACGWTGTAHWAEVDTAPRMEALVDAMEHEEAVGIR